MVSTFIKRLRQTWNTGIDVLIEVLTDLQESIFGAPENPDVVENRRLRAQRDHLALLEENARLRSEIADLEKRAADRKWADGDQDSDL